MQKDILISSKYLQHSQLRSQSTFVKEHTHHLSSKNPRKKFWQTRNSIWQTQNVENVNTPSTRTCINRVTPILELSHERAHIAYESRL